MRGGKNTSLAIWGSLFVKGLHHMPLFLNFVKIEVFIVFLMEQLKTHSRRVLLKDRVFSMVYNFSRSQEFFFFKWGKIIFLFNPAQFLQFTILISFHTTVKEHCKNKYWCRLASWTISSCFPPNWSAVWVFTRRLVSIRSKYLFYIYTYV